MKGMDQLFKMFGFNPDDIKIQIKEAAEKFNQTQNYFDNLIKSNIALNNKIIANQEKIAKVLGIELHETEATKPPKIALIEGNHEPIN